MPGNGGGRGGGDEDRPDLVAVTTETALALLGQTEAAEIRRLTPANRLVILPLGATTAVAAASVVRPFLQSPGIDGVLLVGDYAQVPSRVVRAIDPALAARIEELDAPVASGRRGGGRAGSTVGSSTADVDDYLVWNDDLYGSRDDPPGLPALPVSRVPVGPVSALLAAARRRHGGAGWAGIRGDDSPFAQVLTDDLGAGVGLARSPFAVTSDVAASALDADLVYVVLHGESDLGSVYWGRSADFAFTRRAVGRSSVPARFGAVVFSGCCYGALIVNQPASVIAPGQMPTPRTPDSSIPLRFLAKGARAFVGFTALHYASIGDHYDYGGSALHDLFWRRIQAGSPPARALFEAKAAYLAGSVRPLPGGVPSRPDPVLQAIEMKTYWSATCLGVGW
jgi:hypothetical protein